MDAQKRALVRENIAFNPNGRVHVMDVLALLDHCDVLDDEVRRLRLDLAEAAEGLRRLWAQV